VGRAVVAVGCAALVLALSPRATIPAPMAYAPTVAPVSYAAPVTTPVVVVRPFEAPAGPYAAGHRGVDLATSSADVVLAAGLGRVRFAGPVAGRGVVVIEHPGGVLTEYEPLRSTVSAGEHVGRGQPIGRVHGTHGGCGPSRCLHWSARRAGGYFDPMTLLVGLGPVRLLPWDGA
jgi:murein DD-endopeptidase MepM/ murein hydrolase activator NlpD